MLTTFLWHIFTLLCVPWLLLVSIVRRKRHGGPRHVLVIQRAKIGDMVCTTPLFRALHAHGDRVTVLCLGRTAEVLQGNPCVADVVRYPPASPGCPRWPDDSEAGRAATRAAWLRRYLLSHHFDVVISVLPGGTNAALGLWITAPLRIATRGRTTGLFERVFHLFHHRVIPYQRGTRTYEHYMALAEAAGAARVPYKHEIFLTEGERKEGGEWLRARGIGAGVPFIVFALSAGNKLKEWPFERFVAVARHAQKKWNMFIVFSSVDASVTQEAVRLFGTDGALDAGGLELRKLTAVIAHARLFVSVDTGPLYIAHALGVPVVNIVGPVDPREQPPPPGPSVALVLPSMSRPTSFVAETPRVSSAEQRRALEETTVEMVCEAVDRMLDEFPLPGGRG